MATDKGYGGSVGFQRRIEVAVGLRACPPNRQPDKVAPTNFGETEPLPAQSSHRQDGLLSRVDIEAVDQIVCAKRLMYDLAAVSAKKSGLVAVC